MSHKILADILRHLEFLESLGVRVCLSSLHDRFQVFANQTFPYSYHLHPVCTYFRGSLGFYSSCKKEILRLQEQPLTAPTYRCCYAGIEEWVVPILHLRQRLAYVHIYGYNGQLAESGKRQAKLIQEQGEELDCWYRQLSSHVPSREQVLSYTRPLQYMLEALYHACQQPQTAVSYGSRELYLQAMNHIQQKYMNHLPLQALADMQECSVSYLQQIFRKEGNTTVHAAIRQIRLERAAELLTATGLSVTHIAVRCGFPETNYFSVAFKKLYGQSPTQYRASRKTQSP